METVKKFELTGIGQSSVILVKVLILEIFQLLLSYSYYFPVSITVI